VWSFLRYIRQAVYNKAPDFQHIFDCLVEISDHLKSLVCTAHSLITVTVVILMTACSAVPPDPISPTKASESGPPYHPSENPQALIPLTLSPDDVLGLFSSTTYGVQQYYDQPDYYGLSVTYPTRTIPHTTAFAEGFSTEIRVYDTKEEAEEAFHQLTREYPGEKIELDSDIANLAAFTDNPQTPEGFEINAIEYTIYILDGDLIAILTVRSSSAVSNQQLTRLAQTLNQHIKNLDLDHE
jgi:hypothetical protein